MSKTPLLEGVFQTPLTQTVCSLKCHSSRENSQNTEKRILKNNGDPKSQQKVPKTGGPFGVRGRVAESPNKKGLVIGPFFIY